MNRCACGCGLPIGPRCSAYAGPACRRWADYARQRIAQGKPVPRRLRLVETEPSMRRRLERMRREIEERVRT